MFLFPAAFLTIGFWPSDWLLASLRRLKFGDRFFLLSSISYPVLMKVQLKMVSISTLTTYSYNSAP